MHAMAVEQSGINLGIFVSTFDAFQAVFKSFSRISSFIELRVLFQGDSRRYFLGHRTNVLILHVCAKSNYVKKNQFSCF